MAASPDCVFCGIVARRVPASRVLEDDRILAFLDIRPVTKGHLLVVPKEHLPDLADVGVEVGGALFAAAVRLAEALRRSGLRCEGVNLFLADGVAAGQEVFHTHLHVIPRHAGDGFRIEAVWGQPSRADLDDDAALVRRGLV